MELLHKAGAISRELEQLKSLRQSITEDKRFISNMLLEDKNIREAVKVAEEKLKKEREDLDKAVFSKYIEWKLGEAKLEEVQRASVLKTEQTNTSNKVYDVIDECKDLLRKKDIRKAKELYNQAKTLYETTQFNSVEKVLVYNKLRALYSDIQLTSLDAEITV